VIDLGEKESVALSSLPTDLVACTSIPDMIALILLMYTVECSLYKNANHFLRCFSIRLIHYFLGKLKGFLCYIYLLQSSLGYCSHNRPISQEIVVYRGFRTGGTRLASFYQSMVDEVIVWAGFTSTSMNRDYVIHDFIVDNDSILFEITLHPGDVAVELGDYSVAPSESEILIAASSGF
jgi:hypothetical protein